MADLDSRSVSAAWPVSPKSLVCLTCWRELFSTPRFQQLCKAPYEDNGQGWFKAVECVYESSLSEIQFSACEGCQWCAFILGVLASIAEDTAEWVAVLRKMPTILPVHVTLRGHVDGDCTVLPDQGILNCLCTPPGNNVFEVRVSMDDIKGQQGLDLFRLESTDPMVTVTANDMQVQVSQLHGWDEPRQWLEACSRHACCPRPVPTPLPSRVIDVLSDPAGPTVKLVSGHGTKDFYAALSYCWGGVQSGLTTTTNLEQRKVSFDMKSLSLTIQQAIWVTRLLGLRYLWIDAICIVQDSVEDKIHELGSMGAIYQQAYVTILAANSESASHGFLDDRLEPEGQPRMLPFWTSDLRLTSISSRFQDPEEPEVQEALDRRAWAFQENLLSSRRLLFTEKTLQYECRPPSSESGSFKS